MNKFRTYSLISGLLLSLLSLGAYAQQADHDDHRQWKEVIADYPPPSLREGEATQRSMARLDSAYRYTYSIASSSWEISRRDINQYPSPNEEIIVSEGWNPSTVSWEPQFKRIQTYDPSTLVEDNIWQEWNASSSSWQSVSRSIYERDSQDRLIRESYWDWEGSQWIGNIQYLNSYSTSGDAYNLTVQFWDGGFNEWRNAFKDSLISIPTIGFFAVATWEWNGVDQWNPLSKTQLTFNTNALLEQSITEDYDSPTMTWKLSNQNTYTYDAQDQVAERVSLIWDQNQSLWENRGRFLHAYDASGNRTSLLVQEWDEGTMDWQNNRQVLTTFDIADRIADQSSFTWQSGIWEKNTRQAYQYIPAGEVEQQTTYVKDLGGNNWIESSKIEYYWTVTATSVAAAIPQIACEIANPIQLGQAYHCPDLDPRKTYKLLLMDLSGRQLQQQSFRGGDVFSLNRHYSKGFYLLQIREGGRLLYQKKLQIE